MSAWLERSAKIESAADRQEFLRGVTGFAAPGKAPLVMAVALAWTLRRVSK